MIKKPAVIARTPVTDGRSRSGRAGEIASKWQQLGLEVGVGKVPRGLAAGASGVVGEMGNRTSVLDGTGDLPDLRHVAPPGAALPGLVHQLHVDEEVDVVGDLAVRLLDRQHTTLCDSGRQAVHGRLG